MRSIERRVALIPDEITFVDEAGKPLPEFGVLTLGPLSKLVVAMNSIGWKQSVDKTLERMVYKALRQYGRRHGV